MLTVSGELVRDASESSVSIVCSSTDKVGKMFQLQIPSAPGGNLLEHLLLESMGALRGGGIFAWATTAGARTLLQDPVFEDMMASSDFRLIVGTDAVTDSGAITKLREIETENPRLQTRAFLSPTPSLFHPKMAWFEHTDHLSLIVGSGNLTMGGLLSNWEAMFVARLHGDEAASVLTKIDSFIQNNAKSLLPLSDARVTAQVALNDGDERSLRVNTRNQSMRPPSRAAVDTNEVLVAEIPAAGSRWKQANFDRYNYETFFGAKVGSQRRIILRNVDSGGTIGEIESRPSVEVASMNYRFELAAATGLAYPTGSPPIGIFVRLETGQFLYQLLLPGSDGYASASTFLDTRWDGPSREKRRVRTTVADLRVIWNDSPLWAVDEALL